MKIILGEGIIELSEEQLEMYSGLTKLGKSVSLKKLEGMTDVAAYLAGGGKAKNDRSQRTCASEILTNPDVEKFIDSFKGQLISEAIMSRLEMLKRLTTIARTDLTDIVDIHDEVLIKGEEGEEDIKQSCWSLKDVSQMPKGATSAISELNATKDGLKIKTHDQKIAMKQIADLEGYNAAIRHAIGGDPDGVPVAVENIPSDPLEAAKAYQKMLEGI